MTQALQLTADGLVGRTLAADVAHRLRQDIVSCLLKPGERLRFEMLRNIYGASYSTLREALTGLVSENLVVAEGQRGFQVAPVSRDNLFDLTEARVLIEGETLRLSIERGGDDWEDAILSAFHRLDRAARRSDGTPTPDWDGFHREFHDSLCSACGSPILLAFRTKLFELSHRYRRLAAIARTATNTPRDNAGEHRAIMEATLTRRSEEARRLLEAHIRETAENVLQGMEAAGLGGFADVSRETVAAE